MTHPTERYYRVGTVLVVASALVPVTTLVAAWLCAEFARIPIQPWVVVLAFCWGYVLSALGALAYADVLRLQRAELQRMLAEMSRLTGRTLQ